MFAQRKKDFTTPCQIIIRSWLRMILNTSTGNKMSVAKTDKYLLDKQPLLITVTLKWLYLESICEWTSKLFYS